MKKYLLSLTVLVVAVAAMAFTSVVAPVPAEEAFAVEYQFEGSSMDNVYDTNLWTEVSGSGPSCIGQDLPCVVSVSSGTLEDWLNARDEEQILGDAKSRKQ